MVVTELVIYITKEKITGVAERPPDGNHHSKVDSEGSSGSRPRYKSRHGDLIQDIASKVGSYLRDLDSVCACKGHLHIIHSTQHRVRSRT